MKIKISFTALVLVWALFSCSKESGGPPVIETVEASVNSNGALVMKGRILDANGSEIVSAGFCIGVNKEVPLMSDNQELAYIEGDNFSQVIPDIISHQDLYIRSFAMNEYEYAYGDIIHVRYVPGPPNVPCTLPPNTVSFDYLSSPNYISYQVTNASLNSVYAIHGEIGAYISTSSGRNDIYIDFNEIPTNGVYNIVGLTRFREEYPKDVRIVINHFDYEEALPDQELYVTELPDGKIRLEFCEIEYTINGFFSAHIKGSAEI